jgi:1,4-alpha-glucan branching enzyme
MHARSIIVAFALSAGVAVASDNNVAWDSMSHSALSDRRPLCPMNGQTFDVLFQAARGDLTAARVAFDEGADGTGIAYANATLLSSYGPYDVWRATIPATTATRVSYALEYTDGSDSDYLTTLGVFDSLPSSGWWTLDYATLGHAPLGATPTTTGTVFRVWAPGASSATVRGTFNNWTNVNALTRQGEFFVGHVVGARAGQKYKYFFNNNLWKPDARARFLDNTDGYNGVIVDPLAYAWRAPHFSPLPREQWVVYQLHVGSFAGLNDPLGSFSRVATYREVAARAGHLQQLGVNAVLLNPVNEFPGNNSGGYNPVSFWAFESAHGSADDFKFMIDELHTRGIAVMLDVVWNHLSPTDNFLFTYDGTQHYFDSPAVNTPWGAQFDLDRAQVQSYLLDSAELVLGEYKMDGYRHDALAEMVSATQWSGGQAIMRALSAVKNRRFADSHNMAEIYNNSAWNTSPSGLNLDGQYHEAYKNAIHDAIAAAASGNPDMARLAASIDGSGAWVEGERVFNYYELHDDAWSVNGTARAPVDIDTTFPHDDRYAKGRSKLGNGLTLFARGMPAILQGSEWLESNSWETQKIDWAKKNTYSGIFKFYQDAIAQRTSNPALFANSPCNVYHVNDTANVLAFERYVNGGDSFVVVANFSNNAISNYQVGMPRAGTWNVIINSEDTLYQGLSQGQPAGCMAIEPTPRDGFQQLARLTLPPHGLLVLKHQPGATPLEVAQQPSNVTTCAGSDATFTISPAGSGPFTYQWQRQPANITTTWFTLSEGVLAGGGTFSGTTTDTLTISGATTALSGTKFRAIVQGVCNGATSDVVTITVNAACCDSIDFNQNGVFPEDQDAIDFFDVLAGGECGTCNDIDFNNNGVFPEDADIVDFFNVLAGGECL